jgi:hypothetical protein
MTLIELAEQVTSTIENFEDCEQAQVSLIDMLNEAISNEDEADLYDAVDAGIVYLEDCDCEDADYYRNKYDAILNSNNNDEDDF